MTMRMTLGLVGACLWVAALAEWNPAAAYAEGDGPAATSPGPLLGSLEFTPTAQRPVGWRGDGTGRFPGATPPVQWSRRVKGITSELKYQARKPSGEPGPEAVPLEYFAVKQWLYAGPFAVDDPAKDIEKDLLGGESTVQPDVDGKAGDSVWKPVSLAMDNQMHPGCNDGGSFLSVDFTYLFGIGAGKDVKAAQAELVNKVAYAHTYIYSPREEHVRLEVQFAGAEARCWLNGKAFAGLRNRSAEDVVVLTKGWNRLLVKVSAKDVTKHLSWLFRVYLLPPTPVSYETRNIAWMTKMPGFCVSQPIVVGDKLFVGSGISDLLCISKKDGKILWLRSNTYCDVLTDDEKKAVPDYETKFVPQQQKLDAVNAKVVAAVNAAVGPQGMRSDQAAVLDKLLLEKRDLEWSMAKAFQAADHKKFAIYGEQSSSTPCSDGRMVYWVCGEGSTIFTGYDLDGKRVWAYHDALGTTEHGNNSSPVLCEGKLIYAANTTRIAFDAKTGAVAWRGTYSNSTNANSPVITRIGDTAVVVHPRFLCRVADGTEVCKFSFVPWADYTAPIENGVVYSPGEQAGWQPYGLAQKFLALKLPERIAAGAKAEPLWTSDIKEIALLQRDDNYMVASPVYVDGLVYSVGMGGAFVATDVTAKKIAYKLYLDGHNRYNRGLFGYCASLTLGGKSIYIVDDVGFTHILQPGPVFKDGGRNVLENLNLTGRVMCWGGNPGKQEEFYTAPWFEGKTMFLRGTDYLYCIREE